MPKVQLWAAARTVKLTARVFRTSPRGFRLHAHPFYELGLVLSGECDWIVHRRGRVRLLAGEAILLRPGTLHREDVPAGHHAQMSWVGFDFRGPAPGWAQRVIALKEDFPEVRIYFEAIAREHHRDDLALSQARVGLAVQSLLLLVERRAEQTRKGGVPHRSGSDLNPRQRHSVESAAHYFRTNLPDALSIAQVAAYHSLCPAHFSSLFRRHYQISPRRFLRQARMERAAEFLRQSDLNLKEIAEQCGLVDAAHLCKSFRQERGVTPRAFRMAGK